MRDLGLREIKSFPPPNTPSFSVLILEPPNQTMLPLSVLRWHVSSSPEDKMKTDLHGDSSEPRYATIWPGRIASRPPPTSAIPAIDSRPWALIPVPKAEPQRGWSVSAKRVHREVRYFGSSSHRSEVAAVASRVDARKAAVSGTTSRQGPGGQGAPDGRREHPPS